MFLGGPPLVKMATGEEADDESLGGADDARAGQSGLADYFAVDEPDALRIGPADRRPAELAQARPGARRRRSPPRYDAEELLGIVRHRPRGARSTRAR